MPERGVPLEIGRGRMIREGSRVAILSLGTRLAEVLKAAEALAARGVEPTIADARFAKPLDRDLILRLAAEHEALITIEEGAIGGFGSPCGAASGRGRRVRPRAEVPLDGAARHLHRPGQPRGDVCAWPGMNAPQIEAKVLEVLGVAVMGKRA